MAAAATATSSTTAADKAETTDGPTSDVRVNVLGPVEAFDADGNRLPVGTPRERQLLAVLAVHHGRMLSAAALIDALWGDHPPRSANKTLQTYVFHLRQHLGAHAIDRVGGGYQIGVPDGRLDVARAAALTQEAKILRDGGRADAAAMTFAAALGLHRGDVELPDTPVGEALRRRLDEAREEALDGWHDCRIEIGESADVIGSLEAAVAATPFVERRWAQLMLALYRSGRQRDALAAYQRARQVLVDELGIEPGLALRALEQQILDQDAGLDGGHESGPNAVSFDVSAVSDLSWIRTDRSVGRADTIAEALRMWDAVVDSGERRLLLIEGDAGIGKTTFAALLARYAADCGGVVLYGQCSPAGGGYQPLGDALGHYLMGAPAAVVEEQTAGLRVELAHLVPALNDSEQRPLDEPDSDPHRLFTAIERLTDDIARLAPVLLVVDDWHWATQPTLRLLHHLVRARNRRPVMIVGTYRRTDLTPTTPLRSVLGEIHRTERVDTITLAGLDVAAVGQIIENTAGHALDHQMAAADALRTATGGNPFFVHEVIQHLAESGTYVRRDGRWQTPDLAAVSLPSSVREVIGLRVGTLDQAAVGMLQTAAVVGLEFDLDVVAAVTGIDIDLTVEAAEAAASLHLLTESDHPGRFRFEHDLVRQALLADVSATRQVRSHWATAQALARGPHPDRNALAYHAHEGLLAGDPRQAAEWMRAAALDTLHRTAADTALMHVAHALAAIDGEGSVDGLRADLLCDYVIALIESGAPVTGPAITEACAAAETAAFATGDPDRIVRAVTLGDRHPPSMQIGVLDGRRLAAAQVALNTLPVGDPISRAHVLSFIVDGHAHHPDQDTAAAMTDEALRLIDGADPDTRLRILARIAMSAGCNPNRHDLIPALAAELVVSSQPHAIGAAIQATTFRQAFRAEFAAVETSGQLILQAGVDSGSAGMQMIGRVFLTGAAAARGDIAALERIVDTEIPAVTARYQRMRFAIRQHAAIALEMWTGDDHDGIELGMVFANDPPPAAPFFTHGAHLITAWTAMNIGATERALDIWAAVRDRPIADACHGLLTNLPAACAAELVVRHGTTQEATAIRAVLETQPDRWVTDGPIALGPTTWYLSQLSTFLGDTERAARERQHALDACDRAGLDRWRDRITSWGSDGAGR